jgi:predicted dehydrogenase
LTTRRRFIARSVGVAAFPFISTRVTRALAAASERKTGFALCGLGNLSTHQIAPAFARTLHCRLAGIITGTPAKAPEWQARYGIPDRNVYSYETMHRMADNADIDVVYVVTPNAIHLENAVAAAQAGKHVYCEKPMEITTARCRQMIDALAAARRLLGVAYRLHFEPHHLECVRIARSRELGALTLIDAHFGFRIEPGVWRLDPALSGGGPLVDVGIYCLQASRYLTGEEPSSVSATTTRGEDSRFAAVEASIAWQTKFPGGTLAHCSASYDAAPAGYLRMLAERGSITLDPAFLYSGIRGARGDGRTLDYPDIDQFAAEMDDFADCIRTGKPTRVPGEEGLRDVRIMTAIYAAARTGKTVDL